MLGGVGDGVRAGGASVGVTAGTMVFVGSLVGLDDTTGGSVCVTIGGDVGCRVAVAGGAVVPGKADWPGATVCTGAAKGVAPACAVACGVLIGSPGVADGEICGVADGLFGASVGAVCGEIVAVECVKTSAFSGRDFW